MVQAKHIAFSLPNTGWRDDIRLPLFPVIISVFLKVGLGEFAIKIIILLFSLGHISLLYLIGKNLFI